MNLVSDAELADLFGVDLDRLHELRRRHDWPHVRLGRSEFRFTEAQVEQIVAMHTEMPSKPEPLVATVGLTARSAARKRRSA